MPRHPTAENCYTISVSVGSWRDLLFRDHLLMLDRDRPWYLAPTPEQQQEAEWIETFLWPMWDA